MHTVMVISGGFVLLALLCLIGFARRGRPGVAKAALAFLPVWLIGSLVNLTVGVMTAGYTVMQELPILIPVFGAPAVVALLVRRWAV